MHKDKCDSIGKILAAQVSLILLLPLLLVACEPAKPVTKYRFDVAKLLSQQDNRGYAQALAPRPFRFPVDHGPHPDFRTEWWYLTGNLDSDTGERFGYQVRVSGRSWLDREWSTSALSEDQAGWDWFALQLDDGYDLMLYRIRRKDGTVDRQSAGSLVDRSGRKTQLSPEDISLQPLSWWTAPDGSRFPIHWQLTLKALKRTMEVRAAIPDQFMDLGVKYWEGAVDLIDPRTKQTLGRGYLELTGYMTKEN